MNRIQHFRAEGGASNPAPLSPAVRAGDFVFVSGMAWLFFVSVVRGHRSSIVVPPRDELYTE